MSAVPTDRGQAPAELRQSLLRHCQRRLRSDLAANFRSYLGPTVTQASPLLIDVCSVWDVDLVAMLGRLRPPPGWPYAVKGKAGRPRPPRVVGKDAVGRRVQAVVIDDGLDVRTWLGDAFACTGGGVLHLWLMQRLPETVLVSFTHRELATVVDHPVLRMRPYRVAGAYSIGLGTMIEAEAPPLAYRLPWA